MMLSFSRNIPIDQSMIFEECYEKNLRLEFEEKKDITKNGVSLWMFSDGRLCGETYGICTVLLGEEIEDILSPERWQIYCYSTTILPAFQSRGFGTIIKSYWLGIVSTMYEEVLGHATSESALALNRMFGAEVLAEHENWYGTMRKARFYRIRLNAYALSRTVQIQAA